jgi:aminoglycoside 6'-N-acetyltransferase
MSDLPPAARLEAPRLVLSRVNPEHVQPLLALRALPQVARWWGPPHPGWPLDDDPITVRYVVLLRDDPEVVRGLAQYAEETDTDYFRAGLDLFLDPAVAGRGLGKEIVATLAAHLIDDRGHHRVVIDPAADNARAIACYRAVGFRSVGVMRQYERGMDGTFHDGLMMDLVAEDLVRTFTVQRAG